MINSDPTDGSEIEGETEDPTSDATSPPMGAEESDGACLEPGPSSGAGGPLTRAGSRLRGPTVVDSVFISVSSSEGDELLFTPMTSPSKEQRVRGRMGKRKAGVSPFSPQDDCGRAGGSDPPRRGRRNRTKKVLYDLESAGLSGEENVDDDSTVSGATGSARPGRLSGPRSSPVKTGGVVSPRGTCWRVLPLPRKFRG